MGFTIAYDKLMEVAIWHHRWLQTSAYDPAPQTYAGAAFVPGDPFVLPLNAPVPAAATTRLLTYDLRNLLTIRPSADTAKKLQQLGLTFKTTTTGFWVVKGNKQALPSTPDLRLTFTVSLLDPTLIDITRVNPAWPAGQFFHLTNAQATPAFRFLLSRGAGPNEVLSPEHFYARQGRIVRLPQLVPGTATTVEVHDNLANPADPPVLTQAFTAIALQTEYELDVRPLAAGRYRL
ncbi:MAG: hypothetical protein C7N36_17190, partial [Bacteroidetes bacterium]